MLHTSLSALPATIEIEYKHINKLHDAMKSTFLLYTPEKEKNLQATIFETLWDKLLAQEESPTDFLGPLPIPSYKLELLKKAPILHRIAYCLDLIDTIKAKHTETIAFKKNANITKQYLQKTITENIELINTDYTSLEKKAAHLFQESKDQTHRYKLELKENRVMHKKLRELEDSCDITLEKIQLHLSQAQEKINHFTSLLQEATDEKTSNAEILLTLRHLREEIAQTSLPPLPDLKPVFNRPDIDSLNNTLFQEIKHFNETYSIKLSQAEQNWEKIYKATLHIKNNLTLNRYDILTLSHFLETLSADKITTLHKEIVLVLYAQSSWIFSLPELEALMIYVNQLFESVKLTNPTLIKSIISEDSIARNQLEQDEKKETATSSYSLQAIKTTLNTLKNDLTSKSHSLSGICKNVMPPSEAKSKFQELLFNLKKEMEDEEKNILSQFIILRKNKEIAKKNLALECKNLIEKIEKLNIEKIITENKQRKMKEEKETIIAKEDAKELIKEITSKQRLQKEPETHKKYYLRAAATTSSLGAGSLVAGLILLSSNPVGWVTSLIIAGTALLMCAVPLFIKTFRHYQKEKAFAAIQDENEKRYLQIQAEVLENRDKYSSHSLFLLQRFGIKLTQVNENGDILCEPGKNQKTSQSHSHLFFSNKTGELFFTKETPEGRKKIIIKEEKDISQFILK